MSLYLKYRPKSFDEIHGNRITIDTLKPVLKDKDNLPHAWLFTGEKGTGKTSMVHILKKELNCHDLDFTEINAGVDGGIDVIRKIKTNMKYKPASGSVRIFFIEEAHRLTSQAQEALLGSTEFTPSHVHFILCTTEPEVFKESFKSRFSTYKMQKLPARRMRRLLKQVIEKENGEVTDEAINIICESADGSSREALVLLQQVIGLELKDQEKIIKQEIKSKKGIKDLIDCFIKEYDWKKTANVLKGIDDDPEKVRRSIMGYFSKVLLNSKGNKAKKAALVIDCFSESFRYNGKAGLIAACYEVVGGIDYVDT